MLPAVLRCHMQLQAAEQLSFVLAVCHALFWYWQCNDCIIVYGYVWATAVSAALIGVSLYSTI
jgi:hypothetical protein